MELKEQKKEGCLQLLNYLKLVVCLSVQEDLNLFFPQTKKEDKFHRDMLVGSIIGMDPQAAQILSDSGMGCLGCPASQSETLADACLVHGLDVEEILKQLNQ